MSSLVVVESGRPGAPPVVLLHGALGSHEDWDFAVTALAEDHHVLAIDLPGHGASVETDGATETTFENWAPRFWNAIETTTRLAPIVVGYSMGARLALDAVAHQPAKAAGVVTFAGMPGLREEETRAARMIDDDAWAMRLRTATTARARAEVLDAWWSRGVFGDIQRHASYASLRERRSERLTASTARAVARLGTGRMPSHWDALSTLPRGLIVAGAKDPKFVEIADAMQKQWPTSTREVLPGVAHGLLVEEPQECLSLLIGFCSAPKQATLADASETTRALEAR